MGEHGEGSFITLLFKKLANATSIGMDTGVNVEAAQKEVFRQIGQAVKGGDPVRGEGVMKSSERED